MWLSSNIFFETKAQPFSRSVAYISKSLFFIQYSKYKYAQWEIVPNVGIPPKLYDILEEDTN